MFPVKCRFFDIHFSLRRFDQSITKIDDAFAEHGFIHINEYDHKLISAYSEDVLMTEKALQ